MSDKHTNFLTMTSLNSKLQLAVLNRKKGRNLLEKGFTLVELMIVIVIVGILSSVALPSFLNQRGKAQATEAATQMGVLLKQAYLENLEGVAPKDMWTNITTAATAAEAKGDFNYFLCAISGTEATMTATGKSGAASGKHLNSSFTFANLKPAIDTSFDASATCGTDVGQPT